LAERRSADPIAVIACTASSPVSVVVVNWHRAWEEDEAGRQQQELNGRAAGHALIMVEHAKKLYLVNPFKNHVSNALDPSVAMEEYAVNHVREFYKPDPKGPITVSGIYTNSTIWYGDGQPWYNSPTLRRDYWLYMQSQRLDPQNVFPPNVPSPIDEINMRILMYKRNAIHCHSQSNR